MLNFLCTQKASGTGGVPRTGTFRLPDCWYSLGRIKATTTFRSEQRRFKLHKQHALLNAEQVKGELKKLITFSGRSRPLCISGEYSLVKQPNSVRLDSHHHERPSNV